MGLSRRTAAVHPAPRDAAATLRAIADLAYALGASRVVLFGSRAGGSVDRHADLDIAVVVERDACRFALDVLTRLAGASLTTRTAPGHLRACLPTADWLRIDLHAVDAAAARAHRGPRRTVRARRQPIALPPAAPPNCVDAAWRRAAWAGIDALVRVRRGDRDEAELLLAAARRALADDLGAGRDVGGARGLGTVLTAVTRRRWRASRPRSLHPGELRRAASVVLTLAVDRGRQRGDREVEAVVTGLARSLD